MSNVMPSPAQANARTAVLGSVTQILHDLLKERGTAGKTISPEDSLIEDLGLDSLAMVDLTLLIEERLSISEFPMQEWADMESLLETRRYTVASLVRRCTEVLAAS
jgi:acyl carrier protein